MVKLLTRGAVLLALVASCTAEEPHKKAFWGWCPSLDVTDKAIMDIPDNAYKLNVTNKEYACDDNINAAAEIATEGKYKGQYIGYKGGPCQFIKDQEDCKGNMGAFIVDFQELYYCDFQEKFCENGKTWFFLPVTLLFLLIAMYNLGSTADQYLSPALEAISEKLSCSESLAGVTLLALGNGAPDVFAAYSAGSGGDGGDITFTVSCLMGSAFFITSVVMYLSVNGAEEIDGVKKIRVTKRFFLRDLLFFMLATTYLLVVVIFIGKITIYVTIGFLGLYAVFVVTVVIQSKMKGSNQEEDNQDRVDAKKALEFTELIHQKRDAAASLANGLIQAKGKQDNDNSVTGNITKSLGLTKKLTVRMIDDNQTESLKLPNSLSNRRQTAKKQQTKKNNLDINSESMDSSRQQSFNQNEVEYQEADTIKVNQAKIVRTDDDQEEDNQLDYNQSKPLVTQGSVWIKKTGVQPSIQQDHVDSILRQSALDQEGLLGSSSESGQEQIDQLFAAQKIKMVFKRATFDGFFNKCWLIVELPLNILRDYTCPMSEYADWNRNRATIIPLTFVWGFLFLQNFFYPDVEDTDEGDEQQEAAGIFWVKVGAYTMIPMLIVAIYIRFYTKVTQPPVTIMFIFAIISFVNSISWIGFTCDIVVDLLTILGQILSVPKSMLGFTLLAWGNCLGDMQANVAMTKKGFGEMAITGCMAGPIFNILCGLGLATIGGLLADHEEDYDGPANQIPFSLYTAEGKIDTNCVVPFGLLIGQFLSLCIIAVNAMLNDYHISKKLALVNLIFYATVLIGLLGFGIYDATKN